MALICVQKIKRKLAALILSQLLSFVLCTAQDLPKDSLLNVLSVAQEDTTKVTVLNALSALINRSEPTEAITYGNEARELAEKLNDQKGLAFALKNIGLGYFMQSNFVEASINWEQSLKIFKSIKHEDGVANIISNLGAVYSYMGDDAKAVDYYLQSLKISEKKSDSLQIATCMLNIGSTYAWKPETLEKALPYYRRALAISESINYLDGVGLISSNLGDFYFQKEVYDSALLYFDKSLDVSENTIDIAPTFNNIGKIYAKRGDFQSAIKYQNEALEIAKKMDGKLEMAQIYLGLADTYQEQGIVNMAIEQYEKAKAIAEEIESNYELKDAFEGLSSIYAGLADYRNAFKFQTFLRETEKLIYNSETDDKIKNLQFSFQLDKKEVEIENLEQKSEIEQLNTKRQKLIKNISLAGLGALFIIAFLLYLGYKHKKETNEILDKQNEEIEGLLLNILPSEIAKELQKDGYATPRYYDSVSVLFTDFIGFTTIAEGLQPHELIAELNAYFNAFDDIIEKYQLEKIKTIGDAYMCAGGIPVENTTHPFRIVKAGLAMQEYMGKKNEQRRKLGKEPWGLRIGIHTGPVVAGVVGNKKYAYDIWGDAVNIASRMESKGEAGKVNISATTFALINNHYECHYRGKIAVKNKGNVDMYFIEKEKETAEAL